MTRNEKIAERPKRMGIIYLATNMVNGKMYVGKTFSSLKKRVGQHLSVCRNSLNKKSDTILYKAVRKYGECHFKWVEIDRDIFPDSLADLEKHYIKVLETKTPLGYNLTDGGEGICGLRRSQLTKNKIGAAHRGKKMSKESIQKMIDSRKNMSDQSRANMSNAQIGKTLSETTKLKISAALKGRSVSLETRKKMSAAHFGKHLSAEHIQKLKLAKLGMVYRVGFSLPDETKRKISQTKKGVPWTQKRRDAQKLRK
jgi:group I intron endonuclease